MIDVIERNGIELLLKNFQPNQLRQKFDNQGFIIKLSHSIIITFYLMMLVSHFRKATK
jgi:hypothetical protein